MIEIIQGDITTLAVDAIVNAANSELRGGGGVDGAIHRAAGPELLAECRLHPGCPTGQALKTLGYRLPAREDGTIRTIAFPAISTGVYHFPKDLAARIALGAMLDAEPDFERITACLFDQESLALYETTLAELRRARH